MVHPQFTPEEEEILNRVDPASRAAYEQILAYQKDPEGTLAKGILRQASMGAFQAEVQRVMQEHRPEPAFEPVDLEQQTTFVREQSEVVLERFYQKQPQFLREEIRQPQAVKIVHKEAPPQVTEELMEQLEQQRTQSTVKTVTNEEITRTQTHQVDLNQVEHKIVTQTTQDITELVNKTLARQMRTISDQVYRQMEKRLQTERSRRGRF